MRFSNGSPSSNGGQKGQDDEGALHDLESGLATDMRLSEDYWDSEQVN